MSLIEPKINGLFAAVVVAQTQCVLWLVAFRISGFHQAGRACFASYRLEELLYFTTIMCLREEVKNDLMLT